MKFWICEKNGYTREQFDHYISIGFRWCRDCKLFLDPILFTKAKRGNPRCLECNRKRSERFRDLRNKKDHQTYLDRLKEWRLRRPGYRKFKRHNVSSEWFETKRKEQGGLCAICRVSEEILGKSLSIDHNHETGKERGLLCTRCNSFISGIDDGLLDSALKYLEKYDGKTG